MEYIQILESNELPDIRGFSPFRAVIAIENPVSESRQAQIGQWLVKMGGCYVMICGEDILKWSQTIRQANIDQTSLESMTHEQFVMITEHPNERLRNVFWHAKKHAKHTHLSTTDELVVLHIADENRAVDYLSIFNKA